MVPRTIENTRELDETVCLPDDEEVFSYSCLILQVNSEKYVVLSLEKRPLNILVLSLICV